MTPNVPYGWLPQGKQTGIPSDPKRVLNVFALMNLGLSLCSYPTKGSINADYIIGCIDDFATTVEKLTVIVLDNAPWHRAQAVQDKLEQWEEQGVFIFYLPTYSPHLNPIEILWRKMKYEWLKPAHYLCPKQLETAILKILGTFGTAFSIDFSMNSKLKWNL